MTIRSISPIDAMFTPVSFQIRANVERWQNPQNGREGYIGNLTVGSGGAYAFADWLWGFALLNTKAAYGGFLPHNSWLAFGADLGVMADFGKWKILGEIEPQWASQKIGQQTSYKLEMNYVLSTNWAFGMQALYNDARGDDEEEFSAGFRWYF